MPGAGQKIPQGQKRLTNIAIVRLKSHGKRFEIACYKNKVLNWREGIEKDINEVIQTDTIFENVGKGKVAREQDLTTCFGTNDLEEICKKILKSGELQVSDKEREVHLDGLFRDIVQILVERLVHPQTCRRLTPHAVESALKKLGFSMKPDHDAKKQALKALEQLCTELPESFTRAKMRLQITCPSSLLQSIKDQLLKEHAAEVESENCEEGRPCSLTFVCDPSHYRQLDSLTITHAAENVTLQIVTATVLNDAADILSGATLQRSSNETTANAAGSSPQKAAGYSASPAPQSHIRGSGAPGGAIPQTDEAKPKGFKCSVCNVFFEDVKEYRAHCKSDWYKFNLKRKVKNLPPLTEEEFAEVALDVQEGFLAVDALS